MNNKFETIWLLPVCVDSMDDAMWTNDKKVAENAQWAYEYKIVSERPINDIDSSQ